jgi:hypothetical protein
VSPTFRRIGWMAMWTKWIEATIRTKRKELVKTWQRAPPSGPAFVFEYLSLVARWLSETRGLGLILGLSGVGLLRFVRAMSPGVPCEILYDKQRYPSISRVYGNIFRYTVPGMIFCCLVVTALLTWFDGTLVGHDPHRLYFLSDSFNIFLYIVVVPLYVASSSCLLFTFLLSWQK